MRATFAEFGALRPPGGLGLLMAAPTILTHGTPDQIARHVPPILDGQVNWCQLFSEPGAGSDLAGLTTRAERDGDRWIINGQKVWSSMAMQADYGMLLARTDFSAPKHHGISWFAFPLDQPGVTIRPLREMTGDAVFNEVFLDDAVVRRRRPHRRRGQRLGGHADHALLRAHGHRRRRRAHAGFPVPGPKGGMLGRRAGDAAPDPVPGGNLVLHLADLIDARPGPRPHRRSAHPPGARPALHRHEARPVERAAGQGRGGARAAARRSPTSARSRRPGS